MPSLIDLSDLAQRFDVQNQSQLSKYSVYFILNQIQRIRQQEVFGMLYGDKDWKPNMGDTMQGVRLEPTPKVRAFFRPNKITSRANKDVFDQRENQERSNVRWHKFESKLIYFLRNFQDFISDQIRPAMDDITEQTVYANELFIRTVMWDRSPNIYVAGDTTAAGPLNTVPHSGPGGYVENPKSAASVAALIANVKAGLEPAIIHNVYLTAKEEQGVTPFNGAKNALPKDNDPVQGQYVLVTSAEAYGQIIWSREYARLRSNEDNHLTGKFMGALFGDVLVKGEQKPLRFDANGNGIEPEVLVEETGETIPNPLYARLDSAPYEVAWFLGADAYNTVRVGPPPKDFAGGASAKQVKGMQWNGKVYLTDDVLIKDAATGTYDTNSYGEYLRAQATLTMGALPARPRNAIPILFRRKRVSEAPA